MSKRLKLVYNPTARGGKSHKISKEVQAYLTEKDVDFTLAETSAPLDAIDLAEAAKDEGFDVVCSIGGDGTAHEVANGAIKSNMTFGIIPAGSGNDFSKGIGLSGDWQEAIETILEGNEQTISAVKIGNRYSINVVDAGLGADVSKRGLESLRWLGGSFKYTLLTLRTLLTHKPYDARVVIDGEEYNFDINMLVCGFGQSFGSGMLILPQARFDDDQMSISIIHSAGRMKLLRLFPKVFSGSHVEYEDHVTMLKGDRVEIFSNDDRTLISEAEGEIIGETPLVFESVKNAFKVMTPNTWSPSDPSLWNTNHND